MKRLVLVLLATFSLVGFSAANAAAAPAPAPAYTITVQWDPDVSNVWPNKAPEMWEAGTKLELVQGTCSGALCIHVHTEIGSPCSISAAGCASYTDLHTAQCDVWLYSYVDRTYSRGVHESIIGHEVGHCLGLAHSTDPTSIMQPLASICCPITQPDAQDVATVNFLWP